MKKNVQPPPLKLVGEIECFLLLYCVTGDFKMSSGMKCQQSIHGLVKDFIANKSAILEIHQRLHREIQYFSKDNEKLKEMREAAANIYFEIKRLERAITKS